MPPPSSKSPPQEDDAPSARFRASFRRGARLDVLRAEVEAGVLGGDARAGLSGQDWLGEASSSCGRVALWSDAEHGGTDRRRASFFLEAATDVFFKAFASWWLSLLR